MATKEMEYLFHAFSLKEIISNKIRNKICDKIYDLLFFDNNAALACDWSIYFDLIQYIPYKLLLTPLCKKQSLLHYAINYVDCIKDEKQQNQIKEFIVTTISDLLSKNETNVSSAKAIKLVSSWKLNLEQFEPLTISQIQNFLKWTIYKGHIDDYAELVCSHSDTLKLFVISQCQQHSTSYKSCIKWAEFWKLENNEQCKQKVKHCKKWILSNKNNIEKKPKNNNNSFIAGFDDLEYCEIKESQIIFVNDMDSMNIARKTLLDESVDCIGLDLELMSVSLPIPNRPKQCQILQIATCDIAFIFDLQIIQTLENWDDFFSEIFSESKAIKIGMAWHGDLRNLKKQYPDCIAFKSVCSPYLELSAISKYMTSNEKFKGIQTEKEKEIKKKFQKSKDKEGGLAKIVRWTLKKRLNKFEQLSNWSNRPLRSDQLKYAALDAMVQCWLFRKFKSWEKDNIFPHIDDFCDDLYGETN